MALDPQLVRDYQCRSSSALGPHFVLRHSIQTARPPENLALILSQNDPYKWSSHNARLHDWQTPPPPALKNTPHLSHCHVNVDWRKNGGIYTIASV